MKKIIKNDADNDDNCSKNNSSTKTEYCKSPWALRPSILDSINDDRGLPIPDLEFNHSGVKRWIVNRIKYALRGDELAAEYVILAILSRLYNRDESETLLLGSLSLNLCGLNAGDERINILKSVLEEFVPLCVQVDWYFM